MATNSCLGIYYNKHIVKYAKVIRNGAGALEVKGSGIKFLRENINETVNNIITETESKGVPIITNIPGVLYNDYQIFKQIANNDLGGAINLEFEDWCEKTGALPSEYKYVYNVSDMATGDYRRGIMAIAKNEDVEQRSKFIEEKVTSMFPIEVMMNIVVSGSDKNYILVNLEDKLSVSTILVGKILTTTCYDCGMWQILERFEDIFGSYQKAYDACKKVNVFNDESEYDSDRAQLEEIVEPVLQEILSHVLEEVNKNKGNINKIILTGMGSLFTNLDTLFSEYFNIKSEILKPDFLSDVKNIQNLSEMIECLPAIALAKEGIMPTFKNFDLLKKSAGKVAGASLFKKKNKQNMPKSKQITDVTANKKLSVQNVVKLFKKDNAQSTGGAESGAAPTQVKNALGFDFASLPERIVNFMAFPIVVCGIAVVTFYAFSALYMDRVNYIKKGYDDKIKLYASMNKEIEADINSINQSTSQYAAVNKQINDLKLRVENAALGKSTTNNIAGFMQKLSKITPYEVTLKSISTDNSKNVIIVAEADSYPHIGYFIANLRVHEDVIKEVVISSVQDGKTVIVSIGGDLP